MSRSLTYSLPARSRKSHAAIRAPSQHLQGDGRVRRASP
jgi:hypothetical protein